jgi:hypothetical protein
MNERNDEMLGNHGCDAWLEPSAHLGKLPVSDVGPCWWGDRCSSWASQEVGGRPRDISTPYTFGMLFSPASSPSTWMNLKRQNKMYWERECKKGVRTSWPGVMLSPNRSGKTAQDKSRYGYTSRDYWLYGTEMLNLIENTQRTFKCRVPVQ